MPVPFTFAHHLDFHPAEADTLLRQVPAAPGVLSLRGEDPTAQPYLTRTADLRRRLRRLLAPPEQLDDNGNPILSKRLNLRDRVRSIDYTPTGSDFESTLVLYHASHAAFGAEEARRRLRLHPPFFLRITLSQPHPRVYSTNRLSQKSLPETFGPFPSRSAADRYGEAVLDLFQLRRCYEDLQPYPEHPGCVYGEMNKCLRPCQQGAPQACTPDQYAAEAHRVDAFFRTRGQSLLDEVAAQRDAASAALDFEAAATLHTRWEKVRAASLLADELVRPVADLRAVILQQSAPSSGGPFMSQSLRDMSGEPLHSLGAQHLASEMLGRTEMGDSTDSAAVFLLAHGHLAGPVRLSTLGVRAVREQTAVGSSLFAQPLMLAPIVLDSPSTSPVILSEEAGPHPAPQSKDPGSAPRATTTEPTSTTNSTILSPEDRARTLLTQLESQTATPAALPELCDALSLFRRWYYRPEKQRTGEVFLPGVDATWPIRRILNGAARIVLGAPTEAAPIDREAAKALKTKIIHAGREGVEREVPILPKRPRRKAVTPQDIS